jgi:hypothetical protein
MPSNYKEIREKNIEEYGKGSRHLSYFADLYSTRTHFIYELLQNAEDALSRRPQGIPEGYVRFDLLEDRLEFRHNGAPFVENHSRKDVSGICGIGEGTKSGDYTQIGTFGIGFKSVYAYTFFPRIHSGDEHFEIRRFVEPHGLSADDTPSTQMGETCIVLPFDSAEAYPAWAFRELLPKAQALREIGNALRNLGTRSLLFLRRIGDIKWTLPDDIFGHFLREVTDENPSSRLVTVTDGENIEEWRVFQRTDAIQDGKDKYDITVEVAFRLQDGKVRRARGTELVAYFPTEKKTGLGFLIQAPFKTTKARDNIKSDDPANQQIIETASQLIADSIETLRDLDLLDVSSYDALPLQAPEDSYFRPVYDKVRKALGERPLLPAHGGGFVKAGTAKLARGVELTDLFSPEQLGTLFRAERLDWLNASITQSTALHEYIVGRRKSLYPYEWSVEPLIENVLVDAEKVAHVLSAQFLAAQSDDWLIRFYTYVQATRTSQAFRETPLLRLESGKHIKPYKEDGNTPAAYLPPTTGDIDVSRFPLVKCSIASDEDARKFLVEVVHLSEPDRVAVVIDCLLPRYTSPSIQFVEENYIADLQQISEAFQHGTDEARNRLIERLSDATFIACLPAGDPKGGQIAWKEPGDKTVFRRSAELESWFEGNIHGEAYFPHPVIEENLDSDLRARLGFASAALVKRSMPSPYKRPEGGFDGDADVVGLGFALEHITWEKAAFLWRRLLENIPLVRGRELRSPNKRFPAGSTQEIKISKLGEQCVGNPWLPVGGSYLRAAQAFLSDLPAEFETTTPRSEALSKALEMKQPEREQALELVTGGDPNLKQLIEHYGRASVAERERLLRLIPFEESPVTAPPFKEGLTRLGRVQRGTIDQGGIQRPPVSDVWRYQQNLNEHVGQAVEDHQSTPRQISFSPVRDQPSNAEVRRFLYEQYSGHCQVTGTTFPKASRNENGVAENYFEACALLSCAKADYLNDVGNTLCVSADTMAKFKCASIEFLDDLADVIESFKANADQTANVSVRMRLAGEECTIVWSQRHFMRLVALYDVA